ncbi:MAG: heme lyase CcmF/NrfE family subunit [Aquincola sp.]|nr:heme lyase CcmF/NrfE family subunit [Aquincola sp.]
MTRVWRLLGWTFALLLLAYAALTASFVNNDFSVQLVAENSNTALPTPLRIAATWGNHEGSILLWSLILAAWTVAVALFSRQLPKVMVARVVAVMGLVSTGFLMFTLFTSNPFTRLLPAAENGRDLNPLLQDPGMIFHPPMLYMGYVGFSVAFAFAVAALISGRLDSTWARWSRPWTTVAWVFLTLGIALGSAWAYYELGWGGWWFWDPVENASFMPWLVGTALIHSLAVTEKRGGFKMWTVLLAILAFSLSLLGTFLVRSGVLTSVHAFATDPTRGIFILGFLVLVIGGSLALFAWRGPRVGVGGAFEPLSREGMLLANNVLLMVATAAVMLGTLYPLLLDSLNLGKISVGPAYFNAVFIPLMVPALFLMGVGPIARWKEGHAAGAGNAVALGGRCSVRRHGGRGVPARQVHAAGRLLPVRRRVDHRHHAQYLVATGARPSVRGLGAAPVPADRQLVGMLTAHAGVAVFVIGVTIVGGFQTEQDLLHGVGQHGQRRRLRLQARRTAREARPELPGGAGHRGDLEERQARGHRVPGQAPVHRQPHADDRSGDRPRCNARRVCVDGRAARRRPRLEHAPVRQALRQLDLGRLCADGARRAAGGGGSAVSGDEPPAPHAGVACGRCHAPLGPASHRLC